MFLVIVHVLTMCFTSFECYCLSHPVHLQSPGLGFWGAGHLHISPLHHAGHITCVSIYDVPITLRLYVMSCYCVSSCFVATLHSTCHITWFPFRMYSLHFGFMWCHVIAYLHVTYHILCTCRVPGGGFGVRDICIFLGCVDVSIQYTLHSTCHITCVPIYDVLITLRLYVMHVIVYLHVS
jgi:hypothetical protein